MANLVVTMYVVIATGNHFVADVVAGELLAYSAYRAASWWSLNQERWNILLGFSGGSFRKRASVSL